MPSTILNWVRATSRPRHFAGDISAMYIGDTTDAPPTASPPTNRKIMNGHQPHASAQPMAEAKYRAPSRNSIARRPRASAGLPTVMAPRMVPINALATVKPSVNGVRANVSLSQSVVPEITAVSKPNSRPPNDATSVLNKRKRLSFMAVQRIENLLLAPWLNDFPI